MAKLTFHLSSWLFAGLLSVSALAENNLTAIKPSPTQLAKHEECLTSKVKQAVNPCVKIELNIDLTQYEWLNQYLLNKLQLTGLEKASNLNLSENKLKQQLNHQVKAWLTEAVAEVKADLEGEYALALEREYLANLRFVHQRYNLVTFKQFNYSYTGGAHGMYYTSYFILDLLSQKPLQLKDLVKPQQQQELANQLFEAYKNYDPQLAEGWLVSKAETLKTLVNDNFYLNEEGLNFVYAPYTLAPYAFGEVVLTLPYALISDLVNPEYLLEMY